MTTYAGILGMARTIELIVAQVMLIQTLIDMCGPEGVETRIVAGDGGLSAGKYCDWQGNDRDLTPPLFVVEFTQADDTMPGLGTWREDGAVSIDLYLPATELDKPNEAYLRALDQTEAVVSGFRTASGQGSPLLVNARIMDLPTLAPATAPAAFRKSWHARIQLSFTRGLSA
jgi:hypothetical protein